MRLADGTEHGVLVGAVCVRGLYGARLERLLEHERDGVDGAALALREAELDAGNAA